MEKSCVDRRLETGNILIVYKWKMAHYKQNAALNINPWEIIREFHLKSYCFDSLYRKTYQSLEISLVSVTPKMTFEHGQKQAEWRKWDLEGAKEAK